MTAIITTTPAPDVPEQLERELQTLRFKQMGITRQPVELARNKVIDEEALGNAIAAETARAVLAERLRSHREYDELGKEISVMEARLQAAQQRVRIELATRADKRLQNALDDYRAAQFACAKTFRSLLQQNQRSSNTPGANTARIDLKMHLPAVTPASWQGSTAEVMSTTSLPFEQGD